ncbi:predicted protein [Aspergillus terreus NIH2624]|uniref:Major facilitator superfamily (MFS) profile domain-containing protein n=1 Tax=Aspergillus terreus (strain NIH 2624 / FGSC A1156) TaxID=341663 RepID=Q0CLR0_ASPTN|nr:uncharacterized protein ATEG_05374 [Aspergillus terreus NIH2624]EAU34443.1 predicted protein [Aspergillus terreus NIH2624]
MACICLIGVTLQTSATTAAQFTLGRIINFAMTGFCIVVTPIYQSECSPPSLRGMISSTIQFQILLGQVISSLVNLGTSHMDTDAAWQIPVGNDPTLHRGSLVNIFKVSSSLCQLLCWDSYRLCQSLRDEQALHCLSRLRNKEADDPMISEEIRNLQHDHSNESKGRWKELFDDANRTRTWIAILVMFFQQITGQAFVSQYSVSFYKSQKIGDPFLLNVLQNIVSMICNMITFTYVDSLGRRYENLPPTLHRGLATTPHPSESQKNAMAASMMIAFGFYGLSWAPISYIVLGEVSNSRVKEKTSNLAVSISVITTFIVSFTVPYLTNAPYANLGGKVGFLYGGITFVSVAVAYFYVPELKGLSLEEVDRLFATGRPVRRLSGRMLTLAHDDDTAMNKP